MALSQIHVFRDDDVNVFKNEEFVTGLRSQVLNVPSEVANQEEANKSQVSSVMRVITDRALSYNVWQDKKAIC